MTHNLMSMVKKYKISYCYTRVFSNFLSLHSLLIYQVRHLSSPIFDLNLTLNLLTFLWLFLHFLDAANSPLP